MKSLIVCLLKTPLVALLFLLVPVEAGAQEKPLKKSPVGLRALTQPGSPPGGSQPLTYWQWLRLCPPRVPEIVEMAWALATGGDLEGGVGWFHPGQSRYGWDWLVARYDADHDGTITREEFKGRAELFDRLDRDGDGVLTAADFDWSSDSAFLKESRPIGKWFRAIDANSNGRISQHEWQEFFAKAAKGKDYLTPEDLRLMLQPPEKKDDKKSDDEPSPWVLLKGFATGELGSIHEGPAVGDAAPEFKLRTQDGDREYRLSQFRGRKPVVLIFGSFT
jgi:Ca2+-binding EF-hand superfamily protein